MKKKGRSTDQALLRTAVNKKLQTYSHKRLAKDLEEIENERIPTVGVTARPLEHDLFTWHGNVKGPEGTLYEGGIFHVEMKFPQSYPHHPPTVTLFTTIPHPNVFGTYICLDMLLQTTYGRGEEGCGWSSAYSAQSVLTQLQSFLFEENLEKDKAKLELEIKKAIKDANGFKCPTCKHGGKLSSWPAFSAKELSTEEFVILDEENELIRKQLVCFHTKLNYKQNQLGLGLKISKIPRTGNIREGETYFDYISLKAFIKESINLTSANERINHWMPVYFGKGDNEERFLHCLKKSFSMIMTNSTKNFKKEFILEVFPKLMITIIYHIMDEKKHASIRAIRTLIHIHSMFLYCLKTFPELAEVIQKNVKKFIQSSEARIKDNQSNLGAILAMLTGVDSIPFTEIAEPYFGEQLDRQVLWILKAVPELLEDSMEEEADKLRSQIVFKTQMTSFQIFCFYKLFLTEICERRKTRSQMLGEYEINLCKLTNKEENYFQEKIFEIQKKVKSFSQFFNYIGLKKRDEGEILKMLKQAIKNSENKKYHGEFQVIHKIPSSEEQFKNLLANTPSYRQYIDVKSKELKEGDNVTLKYEIKEKPSKDEDWKKMCVNRWAWIRESLSYDSGLTAHQMSANALRYAKEGISKHEDRLVKIIREQYHNKKVDYKEPTIQIPDTNWKNLFLRLDIEDFLLHIDMNPDFRELYEKIEICNVNNMNTLLIPLIKINNLKSGYYYLTSLLSKLTKLKYLEFSGLPQMSNLLNDKAAKAIRKGFSNFKEAKGKFEILSFNNIQVNKDYSDCLFNYLTETDSITSLRFSKTNIFSYGNTMKVLSNALANMKDVQELSFDCCSLNQDKCKILADSLMRMKKLKIFTMHDSTNLGQGLSSIIYNLAFSPLLLFLDISRTVTEVKETVVSLQKLLKISGSIEIINACKMGNLNPALNNQFWVSLGECKSLRVLDLSFSGDLSAKKVELGKSIAFNAKKKGSLEYLNIRGSFNNSINLNQLYHGMNISEYDEEQLYGDPNKLAKMIASNYNKVYYNNLKALELDLCNNLNPNFTLSHYNKLVTKKDPEYVHMFSGSPNLETLTMSQCGLQKNIADIFVLALDPRREAFKSQIKVLNLSKNNLGKDGIKAMAEVLPQNNILEVLDLSKNHIGVSGAHELSVAFANNKSLKFLNLFNNKIGYDGAKAVAEYIVSKHQNLEFLELGHNRIRDKGLKSIVDNLISNKKSALKIIGLRFNFLTNVGATYLINKLTGNKTLVEELFIRNNLIDDVGIYGLSTIHEAQKSAITVDLLEKVKYLETDKTERTIWIHPIENINLQNLKQFFENTYKCGIVLDIRVRNARTYPNKRGANKFGFVEFADSISVTRALHVASRRLTTLDGVSFRIFRAGTGTFMYTKKTAKQKKLECAARSLPPVPYGMSMPGAVTAMRGRGRGRGRGGRARRA